MWLRRICVFQPLVWGGGGVCNSVLPKVYIDKSEKGKTCQINGTLERGAAPVKYHLDRRNQRNPQFHKECFNAQFNAPSATQKSATPEF